MTAQDDIRQRLTEAEFPPGLLPDNVQTITYEEGTGAFQVTLAAKVQRNVGGFKVNYATTLSGTIEVGRISNLKGVTVKVALLKPAVSEILLSPSKEKLVFAVAGAKKAFPVSTFA